MPIKVLVISNYRDFHSTRPEASIFLGLAKLDFQINIMTYGDSKHVPAFKKAGINVIDFYPVKKFSKQEIRRIRAFIKEHEIDVMHLFSSAAIVNGIRAAKNLPVKVVLYRGYSANINWYDPTAYIKFLHPRVDKIFCNSTGVEEHIQRQFFFDKSKTITINKGHDIAWYSGYEPYDIRTELGLSSDSFLLINVANNRRMKGIPYLLKAFNKISNDHPIHLLLVGNDMDTKQNLKIVDRGNKKAHVHFVGFRKNVLNIVSSCNAFVLSSIKGESITKSVIEAMSLSIAPIITDIAGNRELVKHGESGLVVQSKNINEMSEAMLKLYENPDLCKKLGINAKQRIATHLNNKQTVLKTKALYESLVKKA